MFQVNEAQESDLPELVELLGLLFTQESDFAPNPEIQARGIQAILDNPGIGKFLVARQDSLCLGMVSLLFTISTAEGGPVVILEDLIVRENQRGKGIGKALLNAAIDYCRTHGFHRITLLTDRDNTAAIRFYEACGFKASGMMPLRLKL